MKIALASYIGQDPIGCYDDSSKWGSPLKLILNHLTKVK